MKHQLHCLFTIRVFNHRSLLPSIWRGQSAMMIEVVFIGNTHFSLAEQPVWLASLLPLLRLPPLRCFPPLHWKGVKFSKQPRQKSQVHSPLRVIGLSFGNELVVKRIGTRHLRGNWTCVTGLLVVSDATRGLKTRSWFTLMSFLGVVEFFLGLTRRPRYERFIRMQRVRMIENTHGLTSQSAK